MYFYSKMTFRSVKDCVTSFCNVRLLGFDNSILLSYTFEISYHLSFPKILGFCQ